MQTTWIILAVILFMLAAFLTGWTMKESRETQAHQKTKNALRQVEKAKRQLTSWVRENWPDEFAAYRAGHQVGYQQGVLQAAELEQLAAEEG
jgi:hypothetical protein